MSIFVKGMDMPKGCGECTLCDDECFGSYKCYRASSWGSDDVRASDCPLVEIPNTHGRLIDADELIMRLRHYRPSIYVNGNEISLRDVVNEVEKQINSVQVVIEVEG